MKNTFKALVTSLILALFTVAAFAGPVDINTADAKTLAKELNGVGESRARAIVEYREKHGKFKSPEDLKKVKGIGDRVIQENRDNIKVTSAKEKT